MAFPQKYDSQFPDLYGSNNSNFPTEIDPYAATRGFSVSYQGGDKDRLMGKDAYGYSDFPNWMQQDAPTGALRNFQKQLPDLYNFQPIQDRYDKLSGMQSSQMLASSSAAAKAASNRAMLSGGRVGASFAQASAMLPLMRAQAEQNLQLGQLQASMNDQRAGAALQAAGLMSSLRQQTRTNRSNYAMEAARLAQKRIGYGADAGNSYGGQSQGGQGGGSVGAYGAGTNIPAITPGYIPNAGPITQSTVDGRSLQGQSIDPSSIYRMGGRIV